MRKVFNVYLLSSAQEKQTNVKIQGEKRHFNIIIYIYTYIKAYSLNNAMPILKTAEWT